MAVTTHTGKGHQFQIEAFAGPANANLNTLRIESRSGASR